LTILIGAGLIFAGWKDDHHSYSSSLLQNAGVAVLLLVPLFVVERRFSAGIDRSFQRTKEVGRDVATFETRLAEAPAPVEDLSADLMAALAAGVEEDNRLTEEARANASVETIGALFKRACDLNALSEHGARVLVDLQWERIRFRWPEMPGAPEDLAQGSIRISVERVEGKEMGASIDWQSGVTAQEALVSVAEAWKRADNYPGDRTFAKAELLSSLIDLLDLAIRSRRTQGSDDQLSPLIERLSENWVLTDFGLEHLPFSYWIQKEELVDELDDWRRHMSEKTWVLEEDEKAKRERKLDFWMVSKTANLFFRRQLKDR